MKISTRVVGSFILTAAITACVGVFSLSRLANVHLATRDVVLRRLPSGQIISAMDGALAKLRIAELQFAQSTTPGQRKWYATETTNQLATLEHERSLYEPLIASAAERDLYASFRTNWERYLDRHDRVLALATQGKTDSAKTLMRGESQTAFDRASGSLQELIDRTVETGSRAAEQSEVDYLATQRFVLAGLIATIVTSAALAACLIGVIKKPLRGLMRAAERIGAGDLSHRAAVTRHDEIGQLASGFNLMVGRLGTAQHELAEVNRALEDRVRARTAELVRANDDLANDLTERLLAERAAHTAQERLAHAVSASAAVVYELNVGGEPPWIEWMSENVTRLLGYELVDALAPSWWIDNVHSGDLERVLASISTSGFEKNTREYRFRGHDGAYRLLRDEQEVVLRDPDGKPIRAVGTWFDITAQRLLEEQFRQAQKMEAVGRLAGGVAHDFNNLLTVILAESDLQAEGVPVGEIQLSLDEINKAAIRGAGLTRQLLTFSRRQIVERAALDLNAVVSSVEGMLRRLIGEDVELRTRLGGGLGSIVGDRGQIEQVIVNLVVNARDAMPHGGMIAIETRNARLDGSYAEAHEEVAQAEYVMLSVSDTGAGMTDEVKAHIFEPFFTTKEVGKGTGLGLATCYSIVRQFGGHIVPYSEVGVGTTMRIYLPRVNDAGSVIEHDDAGTPRGRGETILLVEDEEAVRRTTARLLKQLGYTVVLASDGEGAIALLVQEPPLHVDLLLTDVILPKFGGREVAERARERRPGLRVLFMSGYSDDVILQNRLLQHEALLLQKPFTTSGLARKVRDALGHATDSTRGESAARPFGPRENTTRDAFQDETDGFAERGVRPVAHAS